MSLRLLPQYFTSPVTELCVHVNWFYVAWLPTSPFLDNFRVDDLEAVELRPILH